MASGPRGADPLPRRAMPRADITTRRAQLIATGSALVTALLYFLIGMGVLHIGTSTEGTGDDLLGFGVASGIAYLVVSMLVYLIRRRVVWILVGLFDLLVIIMYFAVAGIREPPYEIWGLLIKALEVVVLVALGFLIYRGRPPKVAASRS